MGEAKAVNLDRLAAGTAQKIIQETGAKAENLITKTLGVLQENGVYAAVLFLLSRTSDEKKMAEKTVVPKLVDLLARPELQALGVNYTGSMDFANEKNRSASMELLKHTSERICDDLDRLFLVKALFEQTLIYARYGAKAAQANDSKGAQEG